MAALMRYSLDGSRTSGSDWSGFTKPAQPFRPPVTSPETRARGPVSDTAPLLLFAGILKLSVVP